MTHDDPAREQARRDLVEYYKAELRHAEDQRRTFAKQIITYGWRSVAGDLNQLIANDVRGETAISILDHVERGVTVEEALRWEIARVEGNTAQILKCNEDDAGNAFSAPMELVLLAHMRRWLATAREHLAVLGEQEEAGGAPAAPDGREGRRPV